MDNDEPDDAEGLKLDDVARRTLCDTVWIKGQLEKLERMLLSIGATDDGTRAGAADYKHIDSKHYDSRLGGPGSGCDP